VLPRRGKYPGLTFVVIVSSVAMTDGWVERAAEVADERGGPAAWLVVCCCSLS
jgi:hypothetical protein